MPKSDEPQARLPHVFRIFFGFVVLYDVVIEHMYHGIVNRHDFRSSKDYAKNASLPQSVLNGMYKGKDLQGGHRGCVRIQIDMYSL